jgi:hypothetical protein
MECFTCAEQDFEGRFREQFSEEFGWPGKEQADRPPMTQAFRKYFLDPFEIFERIAGWQFRPADPIKERMRLVPDGAHPSLACHKWGRSATGKWVEQDVTCANSGLGATLFDELGGESCNEVKPTVN